MRTFVRFIAFAIVIAAMGLYGCMLTEQSKEVKKPDIPEKLKMNEDGVPEIRVYNLNSEQSSVMDIETYVEGVLAGEMRNDWPTEALKAQAILARTFVLKFIETKDSKYDGADVSTDVSEAQAYASELVNERVKTAVSDTRGLVVSSDGELANTWFHAHSGGVTELPSVGLSYKEDPQYTRSVKSNESERAPESVKNWTAEFTADEIAKACADVGVKVSKVESIEIGEKGKSGRAINLLVNGKNVSAPELRIALGADKLKSTLISDISFDGSKYTFTGKGFGHGVGMSQWGAYQMAEDGKTAEQIIEHYFKNIDVVKLWGDTDEQ